MEYLYIAISIVATCLSGIIGLSIPPISKCILPNISTFSIYLPSLAQSTAAGVLTAVVSVHILPEALIVLHTSPIAYYIGFTIFILTLTLLKGIDLFMITKKEKQEQGEQDTNGKISNLQSLISLTIGLSTHEIIFGMAASSSHDVSSLLLLILSICLHKLPVGSAFYATVAHALQQDKKGKEQVIVRIVTVVCVLSFIFSTSIGLVIGISMEGILSLLPHKDLINAWISCAATAFILDVILNHLFIPSLEIPSSLPRKPLSFPFLSIFCFLFSTLSMSALILWLSSLSSHSH